MPSVCRFRRLIVALMVVSTTGLTPGRLFAQSDAAKAFRLDSQGRQDEAIALYRQVLARDPKSYDAQYGIARALDLNGAYAEARAHFSTAITLATDDGARDQALRMLGISWTFTGDAKRAAPFFKQVFDRRLAARDFAGAAEVANELGRVLLELGDPNGSFEWYQRGLDAARRQSNQAADDRDLADLRWAHAQARIAIRRGNAAEARKQSAIVKSLVEKGANPDQQIQYPYLTGYVAFYSKDYVRAIAELRQADQQDPFILLLLAQAHERTGDNVRARDYYRQVLASNSHAVANAFARPVARQKLAAR